MALPAGWSISMTRSTKVLFGISAFALIMAAVLGIVVLATRVGPRLAEGLAIYTSTGTAFFCAFLGIAMERRHVRGRGRVNMSIKDELNARRVRASGPRVEFR